MTHVLGNRRRQEGSHAKLTLLARRCRPRPSKLYPVIWRFASERQLIYLRRLSGQEMPWTTDPVLSLYRFTNAFRAADRVSQHLIKLAYANNHASSDTVFLRTILFKIFNRIDTWSTIVENLGLPTAHRFDYQACDELLARRRTKVPVYSAAYIMPSGGEAGIPKHRMHLHLLRDMIHDGLPARLRQTRSLRDAYLLLLAQPTFGPFLAFQYAIDLNYTTLMSHSEHEFVVAGPGALDGLAKCFESLGECSPADAIVWLTERQDEEFSRYGLEFNGLWGRPLQPIDVQNLLCEVSKYTRASHPNVMGRSGRTRIKQRFKPIGKLPKPFFPPKWGLNRKIARHFDDTDVLRRHSQSTQFALPLARFDLVPNTKDYD